MKQTAEEILAAIPEWNYGQYKTTDVIRAMKLYANAKLDEAADGQTPQFTVEATQESIRSFKDPV